MSKNSRTLKHAPPRDPDVSAALDEVSGQFDRDDARESLLENNGVPRLMAAAMLREALTPRQRRAIGKQNGIALVVEVAHPEMIAFVHDALGKVADIVETFRRDGSQRSTHKTTSGSDMVATLLGQGLNVCGISQAPERYLPATLTATADICVRLGAPSQKTVRGIIHLVTGQAARGLGSVDGLSFLDVCSCIRKGGKARDAVRRLAALQAARRSSGPTSTGRHLRDSHGYGEAKGWGLTLAAAVEEWRAGRRPWASIPDRNIVLGGPPGTGKSQFAVSLAATLGLPLVVSSVSAWFTSGGGYLNDVIKAIDNTFSEANANGPCVLLLDELDAVPNRETVDARYRDFWTPVVTSLLLALDGATSNSANIIVVGATNHPGRLDPALVRPGRLNRIIHIDLPNAEAVVGILRQHLGDDLPEADLGAFGVLGAGSTGAEIAGWAKTARAIARAEDRSMTVADLVRVVAPQDDRSPELVRATAYHEAAHAVMTEVLAVGDLACVTIVERGDFSGRTSSRLRNAQSMTASQVDDLVVSTLAGRAIDEILGGATSGAGGARHSDLAMATNLVASKIASWGLAGPLLYRGDHAEIGDLLKLDRQLQDAVERELRRLHVRALYAVRENGRRIEGVARRLLQARVLSGEEVRHIIATTPTEVVPTYVPHADGAPHA
ncbi:AAA family ATPase [Methylobacterium pseudosasicola]|uniref:Peptidase family M41 n=1 Tax=Methylobacterium pseudosasicola TaxID=582667 RepID=A0A1I4PUE7_9HYPH|nr:AAA family ATPase [Methylobacterium pseudosasicola]SFM31186.1 Peptidase family M41 [Methylobacterium pseudosasicola]